MEKTKLLHAGGFIMFKKLAACSLALGILVAGSALFVVQHLPTQSTKLAVDTYTVPSVSDCKSLPDAKDVPMGEKRRRGRPSKAKKALSVQ
ncbi:unnamed protein product [Adineta ricciae]|uniref:Uncharacterized protein n=1 Tax=Adineta ricciae TaxID=249248 RepID=A0A816AKX8_ADIRI|nr:unnamed protein product [Adineta ricciae]